MEMTRTTRVRGRLDKCYLNGGGSCLIGVSSKLAIGGGGYEELHLYYSRAAKVPRAQALFLLHPQAEVPMMWVVVLRSCSVYSQGIANWIKKPLSSSTW